MRFLVTGASGLLGACVVLEQSLRCSIIAAFHQHPVVSGPYELLSLDITQPGAVLAAFRQARPDVVVHTAALTNVDICEERPADAERINVQGASAVAAAAQAVGATLIHMSTDYVFDGLKGRYTEEDPPHPLGVYARTKRAGEEVVLARCPGATVVRTTLYGWNGRAKQSFAERVLEGVSGGRPVTAFTDMYWSPILANDLADALGRLVERPTPGIFHVAGRERCSRYEFACAVATAFGHDPSAVRTGRLAEASLTAPRPPDASLDVSKYERTFGVTLPTLVEGLARLRCLRDAGYPARVKSLLA